MAGEPVITIIGNLTADPEVRYIASGDAVANITVASTPRTLNRQTNQWEDGETLFIRGSVWREYAENVAASLSKGMRVMMHGKLKVREYDRQDGSRGTSMEMEIEEIGPVLRFATVQVNRTNAGSGGRASFANQQSDAGYASFNAPAGGAAHDPWATGGTPPTF